MAAPVPKFKPPAIDIKAFAGEHLSYEVKTLVYARHALRRPRPNFQKNVLIEACVLHLRNLISFFFPSAIQPDDVIASHYVTDWKSSRPPITPSLETARRRANKELAHLTTLRIAGATPEKAWDFEALSSDLRPIVSAFISLSPNIPDKTVSELRRI